MLGGVLPGVRIERRLRKLQHTAALIDHFNLGSSATYIGDNRVLVRLLPACTFSSCTFMQTTSSSAPG